MTTQEQIASLKIREFYNIKVLVNGKRQGVKSFLTSAGKFYDSTRQRFYQDSEVLRVVMPLKKVEIEPFKRSDLSHIQSGSTVHENKQVAYPNWATVPTVKTKRMSETFKKVEPIRGFNLNKHGLIEGFIQ